jgi:hypothetical protein
MYKLHFRDRFVIILSLFWELSGGILQRAVSSAERCGITVYNILRVMLMSSDKHTHNLQGLLRTKMLSNPILPFFCFRLYLRHSTPLLLQGLADLLDRRGGRQETRWRRARTKCSYSLFQPNGWICVCGATGRRNRVDRFSNSYSVHPSSYLKHIY